MSDKSYNSLKSLGLDNQVILSRFKKTIAAAQNVLKEYGVAEGKPKRSRSS
jgi:hypothetical protein